LIYKEESAFVLLPNHYYIPEFLELTICRQIIYYKINREKEVIGITASYQLYNLGGHYMMSFRTVVVTTKQP
jgi:hypothetical protein